MSRNRESIEWPTPMSKSRKRTVPAGPIPQLLWNPSKPTGSGESESPHEHSSSTNLEIGGQSVCVRGDSAVALESGAPANLVRFKWLGNQNSYLQEIGFPKVTP